MMEILLALLQIYGMFGFFVAMMWPMVREAFSDERFLVRKPGETGAELIAKTAAVFVFWPAPVGAIGYYWLTEFIIPWLTQPKT